jgi:isopenicillin-N N-acyltransferase-like protein
MQGNFPFPVVRVSGRDPHARGLAYGREARDQVAASIRTYRRLFRDFVGLDWDHARKMGAAYAGPIERYAPDLLAEMEGVAAGSGFAFDEILALNARSEIALSARMVDGCTAFAAFGTATTNGEVLLCQNWDWRASQREAFVVLEIEREDGPSITMLTEGGIIGKIGYNTAGLGVCLNALVTDQLRDDGVPLHVVLRRILESKNLGDAIEAVANGPVASAANYLIAQAGAEAVDIEAVPSDFDVLLPERDVLCHTNHICSVRLAGVRDLGKHVLPDSYPRLARVRRLVEGRRGGITAESCMEILRDGANGPDAISRREDPKDPEGKRLQTVFSVIMNLTERTACITDGPPDAADYIPLPVAGNP